ncbi:putative hydratase [Aurantimonas manganoxydans SI85-9A1]|uniref:Putative hydratase n=1 Tax=Aurantimonas manganoxydans (strain ATCC BAA-1229 / DSM 21871 / SI85-9A1) TaxID=287752 RepID=Q1YMV3_AURMS|nr:nitrilase family protein [Aurantimonas manganoxydans]EAS51278.1 putative hydratase [Aurantimonas manganoxydans SI85-9A1]
MAQAAGIQISCAQFEPRIGEVERNVEASLKLIAEAADSGSRLIVLPELCNSGYVLESREEAYALSEDVATGSSIARWASLAAERGLYIVAGFLERDGIKLYNSAIVIGPDGVIGTYRKNHLWADEALYFERGDLGFPVFHTPFGRVGVLICYDGWFPEAWRILALQGADIVCVPTNWVPMAEQPAGMPAMANVLCMGAAHSNSMVVAACDRVGTERGQPFIGQSLIVDHNGWPVAGPASASEPGLVTAICDLSQARRKRNWNDFNQVMRDRRTDLYGEMLGTAVRPGWY